MPLPQHPLARILDPGSFSEIPVSAASRWLPQLGLVAPAGDGVAIGRGRVAGLPVSVAIQDGSVLGGSLGEVHCAAIKGLLDAAASEPSGAAVLLGLDCAGARLHEPVASLIGLADILRGVVAARAAGVPCVAVVGDQVGCFGGGTMIAGSCDRVLAPARARFGLSGRKVFEALGGPLDAAGRARLRALQGAAHRLETREIHCLLAVDPTQARAQLADALVPAAPLSLAWLRRDQAAWCARLQGMSLPPARLTEEQFPDFAPPHPLWQTLQSHLGIRFARRDRVACAQASGRTYVGTTGERTVGMAEVLALAGAVLDSCERERADQLVLLSDIAQAVDLRHEGAGLAGAIGHLSTCVCFAGLQRPTTALISRGGFAAAFEAVALTPQRLLGPAAARAMALPPAAVRAFLPEEDFRGPRSDPTVANFARYGAAQVVEPDAVGEHLERPPPAAAGAPPWRQALAKGICAGLLELSDRA